MWRSIDTCEYYLPRASTPFTGKVLIADLDGTLISHPSGRLYNYSRDDYVYLGPVLQKLKEIHDDGFLIAILTNQSKYNEEIKALIEQVRVEIEAYIGTSPWVFIAKGTVSKGKKAGKAEVIDSYRKPETGMFDLFYNHLISSYPEAEIKWVTVTGDAIGEEDPFPPYRWSSADFKLAENIAAKYRTITVVFKRPCDLFGSHLPVLKPVKSTVSADAVVERLRNSQSLTSSHPSSQPNPSPNPPSAPPSKEMVIMVGTPGSGKSTMSAKFKAVGYVICNQDELKTKAKVLKAADVGLNYGMSVVIDCTNPDKARRSEFIEIAKKHNASVRIIWFLREGRAFNKLRAEPVKEIAYIGYASRFEAPTPDEGEIELVY